MCKLLLMAGLDPKKTKQTITFAHQMAQYMSDGNDDGLGYAAVDSKGKLFGEKWLYNGEAFIQRKHKFTKGRKVDNNVVEQFKETFKDLTTTIISAVDYPPEQKYGTFGDGNFQEIAAMTMHTRSATQRNDGGFIEYKNIHPFVDLEKSVSLVHNGIIRNFKPEDFIRSTNDSERGLNRYLAHEINKVPADIQNMVDEIKGSFAFGIFANDKEGRRILDIMRTTSPLNALYVDQLGTVVYASSADDVRAACRDLGWTVSAKAELFEDRLIRIDALTGKILLKLRYQDTTKQSEYSKSDDYHWRRWKEKKEQEEREAKQKEEAAKLESTQGSTSGSDNRGIIQTPSMILVKGGKVDRKYTDAELQEAKDLRANGFSDDDIEAYFLRKDKDNGTKTTTDAQEIDHRQIEIERHMKDYNMTVEQATVFVDNQIKSAAAAKEVSQAKEIIKNVNDPLNENEAANDGYFHDSHYDYWEKRKRTVQ